MTDIYISARRGAGAPAEILYGTVTFKPTLAHSRSTSIVLPAPTTFDLVDGEVVATNVQPTPEPVEGKIEWAYEVTFKDRHSKTYSFLVGVPDSTAQVNFTTLPRYFETNPPLFGEGPKGEPGEAATVAVGTVESGAAPSVTNAGTNTDAVLDFVLPEGPQGPPGVGVTKEDKLFTDAPTTYAEGVTITNGSTANGWPVNFLTVVTEKRTWGRTVQTMLSVDKSFYGIRTDQSGAWTPIKMIPFADLATTTANGLMSSTDKSKLDNVGTLAVSSKLASDAPSTYPEGTTTGLFGISGGWPNLGLGYSLVTTHKPRGSNSVIQYASSYSTEATPATEPVVMFRSGSTGSGVWSEWETIATESAVRKISGIVNASDYPTVQDAVTEAFTSKRPLLVDSDLTATSVDYRFYQLQVLGKGSITVGGNKFWVNPQHQGIQTNRLYINPTTGDDNNSGINPNAPIKTFARLNVYMSMLRESLLDGFWEIIIQAGTHNMTAGWRMDGLRAKWPITIMGEGTRATILDGTNDTLGRAFYFKHFETSVIFKNLRIQNYTSPVGDEDIDTNAGILLQGPGNARVENCYFKDVTTAVSIGYGASFGVYGSTFEGSLPRTTSTSMNVGVAAIYGSSATIGVAGQENTFKNVSIGVHITRNSVAHVDYNTFTDNYIGIQGSHNARGATRQCTFLRNYVGINMTGGAEFTYSNAVYGTGSNVNESHNVRFAGTAKFGQYQGAYPSAVEFRLHHQSNVPPVVMPSGTTDLTLITAYSSIAKVPADLLRGENKRIRFRCTGVMTGTASRTIQYRMNDNDGLDENYLSTMTVPTGYSGNFTLDVSLDKAHTDGNFRVSQVLTVNGHLPVITHSYISGLDLTHDWRFRLYKTDSSTANSMSVFTQEIYVTG